MHSFLGTKSVGKAKVQEPVAGSVSLVFSKNPRGTAEKSGPSVSEGQSRVSGCLLPNPTIWVLAVLASHPSLLPPQQLLLGQNSSHNPHNSVCPFYSACCPCEGWWRQSFLQPRALYRICPAEKEFCVCLMNTCMDGWMDEWMDG